jgi:glycosyltransferase involved in cell wall biosynthesis
MVSFLRTISTIGETEAICTYLKSKGIKIHFDIDDYWVLPANHPMKKQFKEAKIGEQTIEALKLADFVTTTTEQLAKTISQHNTNVYVLPNAIDTTHEQWQQKEIPSDKTRFGYIAGVHHVADVELLKVGIDKLYKNCKDFQLLPAGFNLNKIGDKLYMNQYYAYVEAMFTNGYKALKNKKYVEYLKTYVPDNNQTFDEPYKRLWGLDTFNYGKLYNFIDVSLVPLHPTMFSSNKSELKLIEAGFMKKAVIVQDCMPYSILATDKNCIKIKTTRNEWDWYVEMKNLIGDKERIKDLGEALYESVKDKYDIKNVNVERKQIINKWLQ